MYSGGKLQLGVLALVTMILVLGCGDSNRSITTSRGNGASPTPVTTGSIEVRSVLAQSVPSAITTLVFSGFDSSGALVYGPVSQPKQAVTLLDLVPTEVVTLRILYLEGTVPRFLASAAVTVRAGETTVVQQPELEPVEKALTALTIVPGSTELAIGQSGNLIAQGTFSDGSTGEVTSLAQWTSVTPAVATVSNAAGSKGRVQAVAVGQTSIQASLGTLSGQATVEVGPAVASRLRLLPPVDSAPVTAVGASLQLSAELVLSDGTIDDVTAEADWTSSQTGVATVGASNGLVQGVTAGTSVIEAQFGSLSAELEVQVSAANLLSLAVSPEAVLMHQGLTKQLRAVGTYSDGSTIDLTTAVDWSTNDDEVAAVDPTGHVRAVGVTGDTATITASFGQSQGQAAISLGAYLYGTAASGGIVKQPLVDGGGFGSPQESFATGTTYQELKVDDAGDALVALTSSQTLESFRINPVDGDLTSVDSATCATVVSAANDPTSLVVTPDGRFVYATSRGEDTIAGVAVDPDSLELQSLGAVFSSGTSLEGLCLDGSGHYLFALRGGELLRFAIDPDNGSLTALTTFTSSMTNPAFLQFAGGKLYAVNRSNRRLFVFSVDSEGNVTQLPDAPYLLPSTVVSTSLLRALIQNDGSVFYGLVNADGIVAVNLVAETGRPENASTTVPPSPTSTGLAQAQGADYVYHQSQISTVLSGPVFRLLRKGVLGVTEVASPVCRSISVTP